MGTYKNYDVICPSCNHRFSAYLVDSVNVARFPALKQAILDRTLNRTKCPQCGYVSTVEKQFLYSDFRRNLSFSVYPRKERHFHSRATKIARTDLRIITARRLIDSERTRVVFGLEELREKIVADEADVSDASLEFMKLYLIKEHPFLIQRKRFRLSLSNFDQEVFRFICTFDLQRDYFELFLPRAFMQALLDLPNTGKKRSSWSAFTKVMAVGTSAPWVNIWKLNPSTDALAALSAFAEAIRSGRAIDLKGKDFKRMIETLPNANQLPNWAKRDLETLSGYAKENQDDAVVDDLFEIRFGFELEDDWFKNADKEDVKIIWQLLKNLPDIAVEGNTWIRGIYLDSTQGGGYYDPSNREIHIGSGIESNSGYFRNVIVHEVAHALQEKLDRENSDLVSKWLMTAFGWRMREPTTSEIDKWIDGMGGYPPETSNQTKIEVRSFIQQSMGKKETFNAAKIVNGPQGHLWNDKKFAPRMAFERSKSEWWTTCKDWYSVGGKRFFVNYYYGTLMEVSDAAITLVADDMPDRYAAMSPYEFFAELMAWQFDERSPNRIAIPPAVTSWFSTNVGNLDLNAPSRPPKATRRRRHTKQKLVGRSKRNKSLNRSARR